MRYGLRTLLIVLVIAPPLLAWGWLEYGKYRERKRLREAQAKYEVEFSVKFQRGRRVQVPAIDTDGIDEILDIRIEKPATQR